MKTKICHNQIKQKKFLKNYQKLITTLVIWEQKRKK